MTSDYIDTITSSATKVANEAADVRRQLRWREPKSPERDEKVRAQLDALTVAMTPIRSAIGRLAWEAIPAGDENNLRAASARCQYERRQLKKMLSGR